jgi:hypothetical protein
MQKRKMSYAQSQALERAQHASRAAARQRRAARDEAEATMTPAQLQAARDAKAAYRQARDSRTDCRGTYRGLSGGWERCGLAAGHGGNHGPGAA